MLIQLPALLHAPITEIVLINLLREIGDNAFGRWKLWLLAEKISEQMKHLLRIINENKPPVDLIT